MTSDVLSGVATLAGPVLILTFAVSAVAKLRRPASTERSFARLGIPAPRRTARLVPVAELVLCGLLVTSPRPAAAMALALLCSFTLVLVPAAAANRSAPAKGLAPITCGCFGSAGDTPVSAVEIARNTTLMAAAALAALAGPPGLRSGLEAVTLADVVSVSTVVLIVTVALQLLAMKRDIGSVWHVRLAGETRPPGRETNGAPA